MSGGEPCPWPDHVTGKLVRGPLPAVVLLPGLGDANRFETLYSTFAQQLADHGYIVLSVDPQGQGRSDRDPAPQYCEKPGAWQDPQEAGLVERGECAGYDAPSEGDAELVDPAFQPLVDAARASGDPNIYRTAVTIAVFASLQYDREAFIQRFPRLYAPFQARFTFAGIDAANWLVSTDNPWLHLVDTDRIGIAGHSAGADGAIIAGNAHRDRRFRAAVAWDTFGTQPFAPLGEMVPTIPTMIHQSEQAQFGFPWGAKPPDPELLPAYSTIGKFAQAGVASYLLALRGSTHNEWQWYPNALTAPFANASSKGLQVSLYFTVAWFDRWLKGPAGLGQTVYAEDARRRLTAPVFDDTADRSSIGQGTYDPVSDTNVPYYLGGEAVAEHLSRLFHTKYSFDHLVCADRLGGCP
ncbi:MAG: hypothetical protein M3203_08770 [Actinomycetota bacterium]|nr:hypothetical protein [Actinomycetota bacterium]